MRTQETCASPPIVSGIGIAFALGRRLFHAGRHGACCPMPGDDARARRSSSSAPDWPSCSPGLTCVVRAKAGMNDQRERAAADSAPRWTQAVLSGPRHRVAGALATIGTWIAIGSGPRAFDVSGPFVEMHTTGELIGRTVFGLGAVIVWIYVIALTVGTVRKFFGRSPGHSGTRRRRGPGIQTRALNPHLDSGMRTLPGGKPRNDDARLRLTPRG